MVFADDGHRQVFLLACVLMIFGFVQGWLWPWRGLLPNILDTITTCCLILALVGAALLYDVDYDLVVADMQVFFSALVFIWRRIETAAHNGKSGVAPNYQVSHHIEGYSN